MVNPWLTSTGEWHNAFYIGAGVGAIGGLAWLFFGSNTLADWAKVENETKSEELTLEI